MNYLKKIALRNYYKTASFIQVVADYEGEERRKQERRQQEDRRVSPREESGRRSGDKLSPVEQFNQDNRLPTIDKIKDGDLVIKVNSEGTKIYKKDLSVLKEFGDDSTTPDVFVFIKSLIDEGILKPENDLYYNMGNESLETSTLKNARPMFELYMATKGSK